MDVLSQGDYDRLYRFVCVAKWQMGLITGYFLTLSTVKSQQGDLAIDSIPIAR